MYTRSDQLPNKYPEQTNFYPGQELKDLLKEMYPDGQKSVYQNIDEDFKAEGELQYFFYDSLINYLIRRLITASVFLFKKYKELGDGRIKAEIRSYLEYYTPFKGQFLNKVAGILFRCVNASQDDFDMTTKKAVKSQAKRYNWKCFACGCDIDLEHEGQANYATGDHNWPKAMGGLSEQENLRLLCPECNNRYKKNYINAADYHFEEIALSHATYKDWQDKEKKYNRLYEFAVLSKSEFKCIGCGQPAYKIGELTMGRKSKTDSWHFFNLGAYCSTCNPEI